VAKYHGNSMMLVLAVNMSGFGLGLRPGLGRVLEVLGLGFVTCGLFSITGLLHAFRVAQPATSRYWWG